MTYKEWKECILESIKRQGNMLGYEEDIIQFTIKKVDGSLDSLISVVKRGGFDNEN